MNSRRTSNHAAFRLPAVLVVAVLALIMLAAPRPQHASSASPCDAPIVNEIACENSLPGNPSSEWDISGSGDPSIQGYAKQISVDQGETARFKVTTNASDYRLEIYRLGYYGGNGARLITTIQPSASLPQNQPACAVDSSTLLIDCGNWAESASWPVPASAVSGVYIARLVRESGPAGASHITFIVRDDDGASDLLMQTADTTWQAYNSYGGASLYANWSLGGPLNRAYKVSYNRPFNTRDDIGGLGARSNFFAAEYPMLRWLEANGFDVSYTTGVDSDLRGAEMLEHRAFLSVGHDEYWSGAQRANVESARAAGVNLAFFSGNEVFWKTRWENSHRTLVSYKETKAGAKIDPSPEWTGTWRDPRFSPPSDGGRPENALSGTIFAVNGVRFDSLTVPSQYSALRLWRNTSVATLAPGQVATFEAGTLGYEWDIDADNGSRNAGQIQLSSTTVSVPEILQDYGDTYAPGSATHNLTMYRHASGALVFGAGTAQWSWGLDGEHDITGTTADARLQQATVNLLADMRAQPSALQSGLIAASASTDAAAPVATITSPTNGMSFPSGTVATIFGTATDSGGGVVGGVEVSTDGGATWHPATGTANWSYQWTPSAIGPVTIKARATDDSLNTQAVPASVNVSVTIRTCPCTVWTPSDTPTVASDGNTGAIELGVKFQAAVDGYITGVRFYKGPTNTGTHTGSLWSPGGALLATATFTGETGSGWQQVTFPAPVAINANQTYTASYFAPNAGYSTDQNFFGVALDRSPIRLPSSNESGGNGVYKYGPSGFPALTFSATNYWVDVVFDPSATDTIAPIVIARQPTPGQNKVSITSTVRATFSESVTPSSIVFQLRDGANALVPSVVTYDAPTRVATLDPVADLTDATTYSVSVSGAADASGNVMATDSWSFATPGCPCSIWDSSATPAVPSQGDAQPIEVGTKFRSDINGFITAARFYKGPGNTGTHVATLWDANGTKLGRTTFTNETSLGWQQALFPAPIAITANTTYLISYYSPNGFYSKTEGFFSSGFPSAPLYAFSSAESGGNGVYKYGATGFPTSTFNATSYFVDVAFGATATDLVAPVIESRTPAAGATDVGVATSMTATFSEPINTGTLTFEVRDAANALVPGTVSYDGPTNTASFAPATGLALSATYTATVNASDANGVPMASPSAWSFTTPVCPCSIWETPVTPAETSVNDPQAIEVGLRFQADTSGYATGMRFYKGAGNTGAHAGNLWTSGGALLATTVFTNESASGWQQAAFGAPVPLTPGQTYVISYYAPNGGYAKTEFYFGAATVNSPLRALSDAQAGGNGVFGYGPSSFPSNSFKFSNYWVDVVFDSSPIDVSSPVVTTKSPAAGATNAGTGANVTATFSEQIQAGTLTFTLRDASNAIVPATVSYDSGTKTATLDPTATLGFGATYTATVSGAQDTVGNTMSPVTWSFSTPVCPCSIWGASDAPLTPSVGDNAAIEVGTRIRVDADGYITAIRFYKGAANIGTHTGSLWTTGAVRLANVTFTNETATGWQQATLPSPVAVTANSVYVVSYFAPSGGYAKDEFYFLNQGAGSGPIAALQDGVSGANGLFSYGASSFPASSFHSSNYWVDAVFTSALTDTTAPTVTARAPFNGATGVGVNANVTVTFSEDVQPATISFVLRDAANVVVPASVTYSAATRTATLDPAASLGSSGAYTATVTGAKDITGNTMAGSDVWSFTTADVVAPTVTARTPASGATGVSGTANVTATFSEDVQPGSISFVLRDAGNAVVAAVVSYNAGTRTTTLDPNATLASGAVYTATLDAQDLAGNAMSPSAVWSFTVADTVAPTVTGRVPASGATGVSGTAHVTATFSEDVQPATISFILRNSSNSAVSSTVTYSAATRTVTLDPASTLLSSATYTATLTGAKDLAGNTMSGSSVWSFTIADTVAPTITSRSPGSNQTGVNRGTDIIVTFSEAISPSSSIVLTLRDINGNTVAGTLSYDSVNRRATFNPSTNLRRFTIYIVTVSGARDAAGNVMTTSTWMFRTQS